MFVEEPTVLGPKGPHFCFLKPSLIRRCRGLNYDWHARNNCPLKVQWDRYFLFLWPTILGLAFADLPEFFAAECVKRSPNSLASIRNQTNCNVVTHLFAFLGAQRCWHRPPFFTRPGEETAKQCRARRRRDTWRIKKKKVKLYSRSRDFSWSEHGSCRLFFYLFLVISRNVWANGSFQSLRSCSNYGCFCLARRSWRTNVWILEGGDMVAKKGVRQEWGFAEEVQLYLGSLASFL